jgi:hypothetical protein
MLVEAIVLVLMKSMVTMLKLELVFFQVERVEDVILDCDLDIVVNSDGDVDGVMSFTGRVQQMEMMMKAVVTG